MVITATPEMVVARLPSATATLSPTATYTPTPTRTATPTATALPTYTPTHTPTPDPFALPSTLGGTRAFARADVLNLRNPKPLRISPAFFGVGYWAPPMGKLARQELTALQLTVIRWGGENFELEKFEWSDLDRFIRDARQMNMEPLIQAPYAHHDPAFAAEMVRYVNVEKKYDVRFWSIGNEEDKNYRGGAREKFIQSWRSYRDAMKAVDPRITILGPELAFAYNFTRPEQDWLTPFLQVNGDAVDVVSLHRYPAHGNQASIATLLRDATGTTSRVRALRNHIRAVTGRDIPLAFTEMNLSSDWRNFGENSGASFTAGLWLAETLGQMAEAGVAMVSVWSARGVDSLALVSAKEEIRRPTYYALKLYADYGDRVVPAASQVQNVTVHAARNPRNGKTVIVLVNRGFDQADFKLVLNSGEEQKAGGIYFDLNSRQRMPFTLPAQSMATLTLDEQLQVTYSMLFARAMYDAGQPPLENFYP